MVEESYEDWRPMFMSYKDLKQRIHPRIIDDETISENLSDNPQQDSPQIPQSLARRAVREAEEGHAEFFSCFRREVDKVNEFFLDKQEDFIIEHQQLKEKVNQYLVPGRATRREVNNLCQRLVNFHGQLVLLENFSTVNYTGFRKILKKHDKKTGSRIQNIYLKTVLVTPFFLSDTVRKLILQTESQIYELDSVRKFRRPNEGDPIDPKSPSLPPLSLSSEAEASKFSSPAVSASPMHTTSPCEQILMERPRPHAFISPTSALWRLYRDARQYASELKVSSAEGKKASQLSNVPPPPPQLVALVDELVPLEFGLTPSFLKAVNCPSNYVIASDKTFSMGFFVLQKGTTLQIFDSINGGAFISRLLVGKARLRYLRNKEENVNSKDASKRFLVEETRTGIATGPWPSASIHGNGSHLIWEAENTCAIFYVIGPRLEQDTLPKYELEAIANLSSKSRIHSALRCKSDASFCRVLC